MKTPPPSALLPENVVSAKANFIAAAYAASPARTVERYPLASVAAVGGVALAVTVLASQPVVGKVGGGLATHGLGIIKTLVRSPLLTTFLQSMASGSQSTPSDSPANTPS